jgi:hypothetical protein
MKPSLRSKALLQGLEPSDPMSDQQQPRTGKGHADDNRRRIDGEVRVAGQIKTDFPPDLVKEYKTTKGQENTRENKRFIVECITLASLLFVAVLNSVQTCNSARSAKAAADSVGVARATLDLENRPWLSIKFSFGGSGLNFPVEPDGRMSVNVPVEFSIKNVGKSIAKNVEITAVLVPIPAHSMDMPFAVNDMDVQQKVCNALPKTDMTPNPDIFPVDQPIERELGVGADANDLTENEAQIGGRNYIHLNLVGCATYHSSYSDTLHTTWFSVVLTGPQILIDNSPMIFGFEVGTAVPASKMGYMQDVIARNDAN